MHDFEKLAESEKVQSSPDRHLLSVTLGNSLFGSVYCVWLTSLQQGLFSIMPIYPYTTILVSSGIVGDVKWALADRRKTTVCTYCKYFRLISFFILSLTKTVESPSFWHVDTSMLHINHQLCRKCVQFPCYLFMWIQQWINIVSNLVFYQTLNNTKMPFHMVSALATWWQSQIPTC